LQNMQEQQDFENQYRTSTLQDRQQAREQSRQDQYAWNAYNAQVRDAQSKQRFDESAYDRQFAEDRYNNPYGPQVSAMQQLGFGRGEVAAQLFPGATRAAVGAPRKPRSGAAINAISAARRNLYDPSAAELDRGDAIDELRGYGENPYTGPISVQSRQAGGLGRVGDAIKAYIPFSEGYTENLAQASSGYSREDIAAEHTEVVDAISGITQYERELNAQGKQLPERLRIQRDALHDQWGRVQQGIAQRDATRSLSVPRLASGAANYALDTAGSAYDYLTQ
jgi:hypothetical protein